MNYIDSFYKVFIKNKSPKNTLQNITPNILPKTKILYKKAILYPVFKDEYNLLNKTNKKKIFNDNSEEKFCIDYENEKDSVYQDKNTLNTLLLCALVKMIFFY